MQGNLTLSSFGILIFSLTLGSFGQIFLKLGLKGAHIGGHSTSIIATFLGLIHAMMATNVLIGLGLYVLSTFTWLLLLSKVRLSVAYPMISISYLFVVLLSVFILHERINWLYAGLGLFFISGGVTFIGLGLGQMKDKAASNNAVGVESNG